MSFFHFTAKKAEGGKNKMKDLFSEYTWVIVIGVIATIVIGNVAPDFTGAVGTALMQAVTSMAEHLNGLITAL